MNKVKKKKKKIFGRESNFVSDTVATKIFQKQKEEKINPCQLG
jgi:hypothetical protein